MQPDKVSTKLQGRSDVPQVDASYASPLCFERIMHDPEVMVLGGSLMRTEPTMARSRSGPCRLLALPAEIREQIWIATVTTESVKVEATATSESSVKRASVRIDRFNRPLPPALTRTCRQIRHESLHLYYSENTFECWRPLLMYDWSQSTFIDWLMTLGPEKTRWLAEVVLLYKHVDELEYSVEDALDDWDMYVNPGVLHEHQELSEYELCAEQMGLPKHFGPARRRAGRFMSAT